MDDRDHTNWLNSVLPTHTRLASSVEGVLENLLQTNKIEYLAITSRVKDLTSALNKIARKNYTNPQQQITDLSGIRIVVFFESDIDRVSAIIEDAFDVDELNSSNKDTSLAINQIGYRSVHYVCELGALRTSLPENSGLNGLKFELQIRTVLQHAWAELAHDRNYKFSGKLPKAAERKLFLYAGMLEIADRGLDELAKELDSYSTSVEHEVSVGELDIIIDSLNLVKFMEEWADKTEFPLEHLSSREQFSDLIVELTDFGILTLRQLNEIIPENYALLAQQIEYETTIYGAVRDWMLIHDWRRFSRDVKFNWLSTDLGILPSFIPEEEMPEFKRLYYIDVGAEEDYEDENSSWPEVES